MDLPSINIVSRRSGWIYLCRFRSCMQKSKLPIVFTYLAWCLFKEQISNVQNQISNYYCMSWILMIFSFPILRDVFTKIEAPVVWNSTIHSISRFMPLLGDIFKPQPHTVDGQHNQVRKLLWNFVFLFPGCFYIITHNGSMYGIFVYLHEWLIFMVNVCN